MACTGRFIVLCLSMRRNLWGFLDIQLASELIDPTQFLSWPPALDPIRSSKISRLEANYTETHNQNEEKVEKNMD